MLASCLIHDLGVDWKKGPNGLRKILSIMIPAAITGTGFTYQDLETIQDLTGNSTPKNRQNFTTRMEGTENSGINKTGR